MYSFRQHQLFYFHMILLEISRAVYTEEAGLESYKVSLTEPMHDLKNLIIHILQELVFVK